MKNELDMTLSSRRSLTESVAREQITALCDFGDGMMCPDKASKYEPIREPFDYTDISIPIRWLASGKDFLYRKGKPVYVEGAMWNRTHPPGSRFPSPPFSNYWTGQFDGKWAARIGMEKVEAFVSEMFRVTGSDFGLLTTAIDRKAKNQGPMSYSYHGSDPESGIPGLYWVNFFSDYLAEWIGLATVPKEIATLKRLASGGWLLKFCESPDNCRDIDVLQKQRSAIEWLGSDKFFDIRFPDRKLSTPDWNSMPSRGVQPAGGRPTI